jgi:hypothetical protein
MRTCNDRADQKFALQERTSLQQQMGELHEAGSAKARQCEELGKPAVVFKSNALMPWKFIYEVLLLDNSMSIKADPGRGLAAVSGACSRGARARGSRKRHQVSTRCGFVRQADRDKRSGGRGARQSTPLDSDIAAPQSLGGDRQQVAEFTEHRLAFTLFLF